jgi:cytoskeletal protein CcmA (bactofilin family)
MWEWKARGRTTGGDRSVLGTGVRVRGSIESEGDLAIHGRVEGDIIHTGRLVIAQGAQWVGNIQSDDLVIAGEVHGNVTVREQLELAPTGHLYGDVSCARLTVAPGAVFQGHNRMNGATQAAPPAAARTLPPLPPPNPDDGPLAILLEPVSGKVREPLISLLGPAVERSQPAPDPSGAAEDAPAFSGGFAAIRPS